jgi:hypothetical protein
VAVDCVEHALAEGLATIVANLSDADSRVMFPEPEVSRQTSFNMLALLLRANQIDHPAMLAMTNRYNMSLALPPCIYPQ